MDSGQTPVYSDCDAREILARAIHMERMRTEGISLADLSAAAKDVGISESALRAAIARFEQERASRARSPRRLAGLFLRYGAIGSAVGLAAEAVVTPLSNYSALGWAPASAAIILMVAGGASTVRSSFSRMIGFLEFQVKNAGLWLGFGAASLAAAHLIGGMAAGDFLRPVFINVTLAVWGVSSLGGGIVASLRAHSAADAAAATGTPELSPSVDSGTSPRQILADQQGG